MVFVGEVDPDTKNCISDAIFYFFPVVEIVVSVGEVDPVTKNCIWIQIFGFTNGANDSNFGFSFVNIVCTPPGFSIAEQRVIN